MSLDYDIVHRKVKEDGIDAIPGAVYEEVPDWAMFNEITNHILDNRDTLYSDLKVLVYDTLDQLIDIAEKEVIRMHNRSNPGKPASTINGALGGFGSGQDKVIEIILDRVWELKNVGVSMFLIGHTKTRTMSDPVTGNEYDLLTTDMSHRYFNAFKNKLHILGVASIDREIKTEAEKNIVGQIETTGKVTSESRIITFRDDNFSVDSKSRFAEIEPRISLDSDEFIKAIEGAIKQAHEQQDGVDSIEDTRKKQDSEKETEIKETIEEKQSIDVEKNKELIAHIKANVANIDPEEMKAMMKDNGMENFADPTIIKTQALEDIKTLIK